MLKKRLGIEAIEKEGLWGVSVIGLYFKIPPPLIIPEGCESIGKFTFWKCMRLKKVIIPKSLKRIGRFAFRCCLGLEEVVIPRSVEIIERGAFYKCENAVIILEKPGSGFKESPANIFYKCKEVIEYAEEETGN